MQNLANVATEISNKLIRVELAKARIPAFEGAVIRPLEVPASVVGIIAFANGASALFVRAWYYWTVHLTQPLPLEPAQELNGRLGEVVRVDGYSGGREPREAGVSNYHVDSQLGLEGLVAKLMESFGAEQAVDPMYVDHKSVSWMQSGSLKLLSAPASNRECDEMELAGLVALGHACENLSVKIERFERVVDLAVRAFGTGRNGHALSARTALQRFYGLEAQRLKKLLVSLTSATDIYCNMADLEGILVKQGAVLHELGRYGEARLVKADRDGVGAHLADIYRSRKQQLSEELAQHAEGEQPDKAAYARFQLALTVLLFAQLLHRNGDEQAVAMEVEGQEIVQALSSDAQQELKAAMERCEVRTS
ncbi:hypothetical protein KBI23_08500 [bacterium]|nr:hypothetical protein [bacterium]